MAFSHACFPPATASTLPFIAIDSHESLIARAQLCLVYAGDIQLLRKVRSRSTLPVDLSGVLTGSVDLLTGSAELSIISVPRLQASMT